MFTGLVRTVGTLHMTGTRVRIRCSGLEGLVEGDSVAVDGVCLTVAALRADGFEADVSPETLGRTTLGERARGGGGVNLEPALRLADRLGGHLVSGHVDGLGRVVAMDRDADCWRLELAWNDLGYGRYICEKASICVDGISLTVAGCEPDGSLFWVAVIPHTRAKTTLQQRRPGDRVNLEADLLAKYTEQLLMAAQKDASSPRELDHRWLQQQGWS